MSNCLENWLVAVVVFVAVYEVARSGHWNGLIAIPVALLVAGEVVRYNKVTADSGVGKR